MSQTNDGQNGLSKETILNIKKWNIDENYDDFTNRIISSLLEHISYQEDKINELEYMMED